MPDCPGRPPSDDGQGGNWRVQYAATLLECEQLEGRNQHCRQLVSIAASAPNLLPSSRSLRPVLLRANTWKGKSSQAGRWRACSGGHDDKYLAAAFAALTNLELKVKAPLQRAGWSLNTRLPSTAACTAVTSQCRGAGRPPASSWTCTPCTSASSFPTLWPQRLPHPCRSC